MEAFRRVWRSRRVCPGDSEVHDPPLLWNVKQKQPGSSTGVLEDISIGPGGFISAEPAQGSNQLLMFHSKRPQWATFNNQDLVAPLHSEQNGHSRGWGPVVETGLTLGGVQACSFSSDQSLFAVAGTACTLEDEPYTTKLLVYKSNTHQLLAELLGHKPSLSPNHLPIKHIAFVPSSGAASESQQLLSAGGDGAVMRWSLASGTAAANWGAGGQGPVVLHSYQQAVAYMVMSCDGSYVASAAAGSRQALVHEVSTGREVLQVTLNSSLQDLAFLPSPINGCSHILALLDRQTVALWDVSSSSCSQLWSHTFLLPSALSSSSSASSRSPATEPLCITGALTFTPDALQLLVLCCGTVGVWALDNPADPQQLRQYNGLPVCSSSRKAAKPCFSPDGTLLAVVLDQEHVVIYSTSAKVLRKVKRAVHLGAVATNDELLDGLASCFRWWPDSSKLIIQGPSPGSCKVWCWDKDATLGQLSSNLASHQCQVAAVCPDGCYVLVGTAGGSFLVHSLPGAVPQMEMLHRAEEGEQLEHPSTITALEVTPDGSTALIITSASPGRPGQLKAYNTITGQLLHSLNSNGAAAMALAPDGDLLAVAGFASSRLSSSAGAAAVNEGGAGEELLSLRRLSQDMDVVLQLRLSGGAEAPRVSSLSFSPSGDVLVLVYKSRKVAEVRAASDLHLVATLSYLGRCCGSWEVTSDVLAFSVDGSELLACLDNQVIRWSTSSWQQLNPAPPIASFSDISPQKRRITSLTWSHSRTRVALTLQQPPPASLASSAGTAHLGVAGSGAEGTGAPGNRGSIGGNWFGQRLTRSTASMGKEHSDPEDTPRRTKGSAACGFKKGVTKVLVLDAATLEPQWAFKREGLYLSRVSWSDDDAWLVCAGEGAVVTLNTQDGKSRCHTVCGTSCLRALMLPGGSSAAIIAIHRSNAVTSSSFHSSSSAAPKEHGTTCCCGVLPVTATRHPVSPAC